MRTTEVSNAELSTINKYKNFGLRQSWLDVYLTERENFALTMSLGNKMIESGKAWFRQALLMDEKNCSPLKLLDLAELRGSDCQGLWDAIWFALSNRAAIVKWFVTTTKINQAYSSDDLFSLMGSDIKDATKKGGISALKDMLTKLKGKKTNDNTETSLIEQFWYPKYGPGQLWELVGKRVTEMGGNILYGRKVTEIVTDGRKVSAVKCGDKEFIADEVISSMPIKDLVDGMNAPPDIKRIADGLPYRDFVTVGLLVNKLKLKNKTNKRTLGNIVPDCWIYVQDKGVKLGRIQIFNNWSPYMVADPVGTVWIGLEYFCTEGDRFWNMSEKECVAFAVKELRKMGVIGKNAVLDFHRERVKKAYPAYFDTYADFGKVKIFLDSYENLWCVGRNGQHRYNNMDHSMMTAIETVRLINSGIRNKRAVWNVNTEKEYHEQRTINRASDKVNSKAPVSLGTGALSAR